MAPDESQGRAIPNVQGGKGKLTVLDEDGNEVELDATCADDGPEEGEDVILLKRGKGKGQGDEVRGSANTSDIDERIDRHKENAPEDRKAQFDEFKEERAAKQEGRASPRDRRRGPSGREGEGPGRSHQGQGQHRLRRRYWV